MRRDPTEFRERFAKWKAGEKVYENGLPTYGGGKGNPPLIPDLKSENTNDGFIPDFEEPVNTAAGLTVGGDFGVNPTKVADNVAASRLLNRTFVEDSAAKYGTRHFGDAKISPESFYKMYRDSAGFRTRYDRGFALEGRFYNDNMDARRIPIVKDSPGWTYNEDTGNYGGGGSSAYYTPQTNKIFIDSSNPTHEYFGGAKGVLAHELGHSVYNNATGIDFSKIRSDQPLYQYNLLNGKNKHNYRDAVNKMMSNDQRLGGDTADWSHDSNPEEGGADMTQLRYLLYKNGVFNSADSNAKIDAELLQNFYNQYKKDNPNVPYIRGIENYGIDKATYLLNNTASLDKKFDRGNGLMLAKNGKLAILPMYGGGKPGSKRRYDYKYVQAGKDNGWERITDDKMSDVFLDFVARPKSRGGNTDTYNWKKQWAPKSEPGLEIVSPEFDLLMFAKGVLNNIPTKTAVDKYKNFTDAQWDNAYNKAIKSGNTKDVLALRDMHFKIKTPKNVAVDENGNPIRTYHTVGDLYNPNFNEFDPNIEGTHSAIYTSNDPMMSGTYSSYIVSDQELQNLAELMRLNEIDNITKGYVKGGLADLRKAILSDPERGREYIIKNTWLNLPIQPLRQKQLYTNIENPVIINLDGHAWNNINLSELRDNYPDVYKEIKPGGGLLSNNYTTRSLEAAQKATGHDGAIVKNVLDYGGSRKTTVLDWTKPNDVYMTNSPYKIKLADAITYDDNGKIIPLSKRDNFNIADIRYGVIPPMLGYSLYNKYAE